MLLNYLTNSILGTLYTDVHFPFAWKIESGQETQITMFIKDNVVNHIHNTHFPANVFLPSPGIPSAR